MKNEELVIKIEGKEVKDIYGDILGLEVEFDCQLASGFTIWLPMVLDGKGKWSYVDDQRFRVWKKVSIRAGFGARTEELISGYITHVYPEFDPDPSKCILEIRGMDKSVLMDREEKLKDWPNKKDSDIAREILIGHKFIPKVENTRVVHDQSLSTIIQRETDMRFLKRLARRNGFECYVEGRNAYFGKPRLNTLPQPVLACHFGEETNLSRFFIEINALEPVTASMFQVDRRNKRILDSKVEDSHLKDLGKRGAKKLPGPGIRPARVYAAMNVVTGKGEMDALCRGMVRDSQWFVTAKGKIRGNIYGHILKAGRNVTIKGIGKTHSGIYYVSHVTHSFSPAGYFQYFKAKRNALEPTGMEKFSKGLGL